MEAARVMVLGLAAAGLAASLAAGAGCASAGRPAASPAARAAAPVPPPPPGWGSDPADRAPGPVLFQVDGAGGRLDLFGTLHTEPLAMLPPAVAARYEEARIVAFEVDLQNVNVMKVLALSTLPLRTSLDELVGPERWEKLVKYLDGSIAPAALKRFRPWLAMALMLQKASGVPPKTETMETGLLKGGRASGKEMRFLETVEEQMALLDRTIDVAFLIKLIDGSDQLGAALQSMTNAYRAGDITAVEHVVAQMGEPGGLSGEQMQTVLGGRNERWIPFLERLAGEGHAFVAVGAAHLVGPGGVVALMRARGYHVARVPGVTAPAAPAAPSP